MKEEKESKLIMALGNSGSLLAEAQTDDGRVPERVHRRVISSLPFA